MGQRPDTTRPARSAEPRSTQVIVSGLMALALMTGGTTGPDKSATMRYKVDVTVKQSVDLTPMGQGVMDSDINAAVWVVVTMADTTGGQTAHVVIDSMTVEATGMAGAQFPQEAVNGARGASFHAYIVDGKVKGTPELSVSDNMAVMVLGSPALSALFIGMPAGKKIGDTWADTTNTTSTAENGMSGQSVVEWKVVGMDGDAYVVAGTSTGTVSGEQQGQQISGTVEGTTEATTTTGGPAKAATVKTTQAMEVLVPQAPDVIRVQSTSSAVVTRLD
jgi:hypothetical protein